ncbi:MAG: S8 family serine peptidase [Chloroflexi bacterium]|nr:S8 family serine peptidase [Chloroflexota bacterium]
MSAVHRGRYRMRVVIAAVLAIALLVAPTFASSDAPCVAAQAPSGVRYIISLETTGLELASQDEAAAARGGPPLAYDALAADVMERVAQIPGASVETRLGGLFEGLVVRIGAGDEQALASLSSLPGVRAVYPDAEFGLAMDQALEVTGVDLAWAMVGGSASAGAGVRVALIDGGVDPAHPMLSAPDWAFPAGYPLGWPAYASPKVIAARAYFRAGDPPAQGEGTPSPGSLSSGHGTHMAAVVAGMPVTVTLDGQERSLAGVAPGARLMNYRVFYPSASDGYERAYAAEIIQAIADAVQDGANVLCLGWSGGAEELPYASPVADALRAAMDLGVIVVAPAGNDGPGHGSASRLPGGIEEVITVGAQGVSYGRAQFGASLVQDTPLVSLQAIADVAAGGDPYGCAPVPAGSLNDAAVLIRRGACSFADKAYHAQQAGAAISLIINDEDTVTEMGCSGAYCAPGTITIPVAMLPSAAGEQLLTWAQTFGAMPTVMLGVSGRLLSGSPELLPGFSARGPAFGLYLKPDLVAPGAAILSAAPTGGTAGEYSVLSGTSIAAAHVAGAAAVVLGTHPGWQQQEVKAALMGTARRGAADGIDEPAARQGVLDYGAGLLDLPRALSPSLLIDPASLSLGSLSDSNPREVQLRVRDVRTSGETREWSIQTELTEGLSLVSPQSLNTQPGEEALLELAFSMAPGAEASLSAVVTLSDGSDSYRLPVWGAAEPLPAGATVLLVDNDLEFSGGSVDTRPSIEAVLTQLGVSFAVWDSDALAGAAQTWPDAETLQGYEAIIWTLGEKLHPDGTFAVSTPPTSRDEQALMSYLDSGGRLLAMGQNAAEALDTNPDPDPVWGRSTLFHAYLGSHWLQGNVFGTASAPPETVAVTGLPGTFMQGVLLDLGALGSGAGNQHSIDELGAGGAPSAVDDRVVPVAAATGSKTLGAGYVMLAIYSDPTLEDPDVDITYRAVNQSFGLEGINDRIEVTRARDLLRRQLDWLLDDLDVTVASDLVGGPYAVTCLVAEAASSVGASIVSERWRVGEGASAEIVAAVGGKACVTFTDVGEYPVTVEVRDALGHTALGEGVVRIVPGGASDLRASRSEALAGDEIVYTIRAMNTGLTSIEGRFSMPLPAGVTHLSHTGEGVSYIGGVLEWQGALAPGATHTASLTVQIGEGHEPGALIQAAATFTMEGTAFVRRVATEIGGYPLLFLPVLRR